MPMTCWHMWLWVLLDTRRFCLLWSFLTSFCVRLQISSASKLFYILEYLELQSSTIKRLSSSVFIVFLFSNPINRCHSLGGSNFLSPGVLKYLTTMTSWNDINLHNGAKQAYGKDIATKCPKYYEQRINITHQKAFQCSNRRYQSNSR